MRLNGWTKAYLGLVAFSLAGTALSLTTGLNPGPIAPVASLLTLGLGFGGLVRAVRRTNGQPTAVRGFLAVLVIGALSEVVGLYTGLPFGAYTYTDAWWPTVPLPGDHRFPLLLPLAWGMVVGSAALIACRHLARTTAIFVAALAASLLDLLLMEPVMAGPLGYWRWLEPGPLPGGAPVLNSVGWFFTSLLGAWALLDSGARTDTHEPEATFLGHLTLTAGLGLLYLLH